ncbi:MAG: DUF3341 domain-containing protein [Kofleriaceae bacterium]|nr:DUF3341 domain-containing protein [Kofleriaceae bacterium]
MIHVFAEYADPAALARAIDEVRAWGPVRVEAYTPYYVPEVERAIGARPSRLPIAVLIAGLLGAAGAYGLQWLLNAYLYPLNVGGRPPHFPLAFVPITFEMGVLLAALTAVGAVLVGARLLRLWYPSSEVIGIESATAWRFWLDVAPVDSTADVDALISVVQRTQPLAVQRLEVA